MKTFPVLMLLFTLGWATVQAQTISLTPFGGYTFDDKFVGDNFDGKIKGAAHWGIALEYGANEFYGIELLYQRMDTDAPVRILGTVISERQIGLGINYILIGGTRYVPTQGAAKPYGGLSLGMAIPYNKDSGESITKFAWGAKLGVLVMPSEKVGIKAQMQLYSMVQGAGGGFYFGTGGAGVGVSTYSSVYQFGFTGGLVIRFGPGV